MSRFRSVRRALALAGLAVLVTLAPACARRGERRAPAHESEAVEDRPSESSLYDLDLALTDQDGRATRLATLRGRPLIATMMYTSCRSECPRVTEDMRRIDTALGPADAGRFRFVLFSLDPARDSPAALRAYAEGHHLDPARWTLYATSEEGTRDLAAVLGFRYRPDEGGQIAHSAVVFLVDPEGHVVHRQVGLGGSKDEFLAAARKLER